MSFKSAKRNQQRKNRNPVTLDDLLITPIQRLPRYQMFLKELIHLTPTTHTDYDHLVLALDRLTQFLRQFT